MYLVLKEEGVHDISAKSPTLPVPRFFEGFEIKGLHKFFFRGKGFLHSLNVVLERRAKVAQGRTTLEEVSRVVA